MSQLADSIIFWRGWVVGLWSGGLIAIAVVLWKTYRARDHVE